MKLFISAELSTLSPKENMDRTESLMSELEALGVSFKSVDGMYKGTSEQSFMVESPFSLEYLIAIARKYRQESIMLVRGDRSASLLFVWTGAVESIGMFQRVESTAGLDAYSVIDGQIYTVK